MPTNDDAQSLAVIAIGGSSALGSALPSDWRRELARQESLYVEPATAAANAAVSSLRNKRRDNEYFDSETNNVQRRD